MKIPLRYRFIGFVLTKLQTKRYSNKLFKQLSNKNINFIQIGANDGVSQDPIYRFNEKWSGILVEPIPEMFEQLKFNYFYKSKGKFFENLAIGEKNSIMDLKIPKYSEKNKDYRNKVASLVESNFIKMEDYETIKTQVITLDQLIVNYKVDRIDLLLLDVEGYEISILNAFSFNPRPKIIYMETRFFCFDEIVKFNDKMLKLGYFIFPEADNCLFIQK
jgi:FkbM family methyltransferase